MLRSASAYTLPPRPPSPPSGPPRGTYFSRRNDAEPSPPLPAVTSMRASSKNFMAGLSRDRDADAERDEREAREHVQPLAHRGLAADPGADVAREERDRPEDDGGLRHEDRAEERHLDTDVPRRRVHELRQEREEEERDLRVEH